MTLNGVKQRFGIIGRSETLDNALSTAIRVAQTDLSVLIQGESGVGKEAFSKIIHSLSKRKHNNFIAINCGAIPEGTINSELFGHEKGAFTGASSDRSGYFETVNGGTIFLDEIGEMPLDTQSYLLRVLESGEYIKVGSSVVHKTDVRIIAATNVNLKESIKKGKFREDLYYRLNTVPIKVPALHERREDIYMLFRKFAIDFAEKYNAKPKKLDDHAQLMLENYKWPGNVRELRNVVEQLSVMCEEDLIDADILRTQVPQILNRDLPAMVNDEAKNASDPQERELLYKFLVDMKRDLNDLKSLVFEIVKDNDLDVSTLDPLRSTEMNYPAPSSVQPRPTFYQEQPNRTFYDDESQPIIINNPNQGNYHAPEIVEENLSLEAMEKQMIIKALDRYNGKRKDAAEELGISERTLYRKIKQYELE